MADYAFFIMGVFALAVVAVVGVVCVLLTIACIVAARKTRKPSSGRIGLILALGSVLTCGLTALPGLVFGLVGIRQKAYPRLSWTAVVLSVSVIVLCIVGTIRFFSMPEGTARQFVEVDVSDKALAPYQAALAVDRLVLGFPPLPTNGTVQIETVDRANWDYDYAPPLYDVMLHFDEITDRGDYPYVCHTVALEMTTEGFKWINEQIAFTGPNRLTSTDGTSNEEIIIRCEKEPGGYFGTPFQGTAILYDGNDPRLAGATWPHEDNLIVEQIAPILREWGYDYEVDRAQPKPEGDGLTPAPEE